jgi:hypothetical protein
MTLQEYIDKSHRERLKKANAITLEWAKWVDDRTNYIEVDSPPGS